MKKELRSNFLAFSGRCCRTLLVLLLIVAGSSETLCAQSGASRQAVTVNGSVVNSKGEAIVGAGVVVKGTTRGAITDARGAFSIQVPEGESLTISYLGYVTQEITPGNRTQLAITLDDDAMALEDVVVVGYGTQKRANLTGAVGSIDAQELTSRISPNTTTLLQGRVPGLKVVQNSAMPGSEQATIQIRGQGTFSGAGNNPLILIDGIEGNLNNLNPNVIESVVVLKDASSAAIYGSRAANGVILVTTKTGTEGRLNIDYTFSIGFQNPTTRQERITNSIEYMKMANSAVKHSGVSNEAELLYSDAILAEWAAGQDPANPAYNPAQYPNSDWLDYLIRDNASLQQHFLSINGGKGGTTYNFGLGLLDQVGMLIATDYKRYDAQMNLKTNLGSRVTFGSNISFAQGRRTDTAQGGTPFETNQTEDQMLSAYSRAPMHTPTLPDGSGLYSAYAYKGRGGNKNPIAIAENGGQRWKEYYTLASAFLRVDILPGLTGEVKGAVQYSQKQGKALTVSVNAYNFFPDANGEYKQDGTYNGINNALTVRNEQDIQYTLYGTLNYTKTFGDGHNVGAMAGYSQENFLYNRLQGYRANMPGILWELDAAPVSGQVTNGYSYEWALQSVFGRVNYDYRGKYLFEGNFRYDGTSRLPKESRWGVFPSFSAGWRISEERFLTGFSWLQNAKLRASWGQLGNQNIGNYPYQDNLSTTVYNIGGNVVQGWTLKNMINRDLKWETTTVVNAGLDLGFFNGKLYATVDWYNKKTTGILRSLQLPAHTGLNSPTVNDGILQNRGWELLVGHNNRIGDFSYGIDFLFDANRNKVLQFGSREIDSGNGYIRQEGLPYNSYYMYIFDGIYQNAQQIADQKPLSTLTKPGDIRYKAFTDPTKSTTDDRVVVDGAFPKFNYGFNFNASWRNFDLALFFQGVAGKKVYVKEWGIAPFRQGSPPPVYWRDAWDGEGTSTTIPHIFWENYAPNTSYPSTFWLQDASYLRLKNLQFGYTLPARLTKKAGIQLIRIFYSADNLLTFTKMFQGIDPERTAQNARGVIYPQARLHSFGIKITL